MTRRQTTAPHRHRTGVYRVGINDEVALAAGIETGWYDEHGRPAPWPDDFFDHDSGWTTTTPNPITNQPGEPDF